MDRYTQQRFDRLVVARYIPGSSGSRATCYCKCDCGKEKVVLAEHLWSGKTQSCGCYASELTAKRNSENVKHGLFGSPEYKTLHAIKDRCLNLNSPIYYKYGGAGITICDRWTDPEYGVKNFLIDMGLKPSSEHSIDRYPDKAGNYDPDNCRWATSKEQARNTKANHLITCDDRTQCIAAWAEELKMTTAALHSRLRRRDYDPAYLATLL